MTGDPIRRGPAATKVRRPSQSSRRQRKSSAASTTEDIVALLGQPVSVRSGGKTVSMQPYEAMLRATLRRAMTEMDVAAIRTILKAAFESEILKKAPAYGRPNIVYLPSGTWSAPPAACSPKTPIPDKQRSSENSRSTGLNEVGYCRPPKEHQFKKGQSGNPAGRPRKRRRKSGRHDIVERVLLEEHPLTVDGKPRRRTALEIVIITLRNLAFAGNNKAVKIYEQLEVDLLPKSVPRSAGLMLLPTRLSNEEFAARYDPYRKP